MKNKLPIEINNQKENIARLIKAYLDDSIALSDKDKSYIDRLINADDALKDLNFSNNEKRAEYLKNKFKISLSTARKDLKAAEEFFNTIDSYNRATGTRIIRHQIDMFLSLCLQAEDFKSAAAFMKLKVEINKQTLASPLDPKTLQQNNFVFNIGGKLKDLGENVDMREVDKLLEDFNLSSAEKKKITQEIDFENI